MWLSSGRAPPRVLRVHRQRAGSPTSGNGRARGRPARHAEIEARPACRCPPPRRSAPPRALSRSPRPAGWARRRSRPAGRGQRDDGRGRGVEAPAGWPPRSRWSRRPRTPPPPRPHGERAAHHHTAAEPSAITARCRRCGRPGGRSAPPRWWSRRARAASPPGRAGVDAGGDAPDDAAVAVRAAMSSGAPPVFTDGSLPNPLPSISTSSPIANLPSESRTGSSPCAGNAGTSPRSVTFAIFGASDPPGTSSEHHDVAGAGTAARTREGDHRRRTQQRASLPHA